MEIARFRRLCRITFFLSAMVACFGIGFYLMDSTGLGICLIIAGMAVAMICFSLTKMFALYDFQHRTRR